VFSRSIRILFETRGCHLLATYYRFVIYKLSCKTMKDDEFIENAEFNKSKAVVHSVVEQFDLAVSFEKTTVCPIDRLEGQWSFLSMPQLVHLDAYGKQFLRDWPLFCNDTSYGKIKVRHDESLSSPKPLPSRQQLSIAVDTYANTVVVHDDTLRRQFGIKSLWERYVVQKWRRIKCRTWNLFFLKSESSEK